MRGSEDGWQVLAIGMRYDAMAWGVRALAAAGADVIVYPLGPGSMFGEDWEVITEEDAEVFDEPLPDDSGRLDVVELLEGQQVVDVVSERAIDTLWTDALSKMGQINAVYLSPWYGFTAFELGRDLMRLLQSHGGGQLIVTDPPGGDDQRLRWYDLWQHTEGCDDVEVVVLSEPRRDR